MRNVTSESLRLVPASEGLVQRSGLYNPLMRKLRSWGCHDRQARWRPLLRGFWASTKQVRFRRLHTVRAITLGCLLEPRFNYRPLLIPHTDTALQLFPHRRVMRLEAGGETCDSDFLDSHRFSCSHRATRSTSTQSAAGGQAGRKIELARTMSGICL